MLKKLTLKWVNRKRLEFGLPEIAELPVGEMARASSCPVSNALGTYVYVHYRSYGRWDGFCKTGKVPWYVGQFIWRFDHGHYPELRDDFYGK